MVATIILIFLWLAPSALAIYLKGLTRAVLFIPISLFVGLVGFLGSAFVAEHLGATGAAIPLSAFLGGIAANAAHLWIEIRAD